MLGLLRNGEQWARSLHGKLERYRIPRNLRADPTSGIPAAQRLRPVFRDDDELPASGDLGDRLRDALDHSRYLIVLASTAAAGSKWVDAGVAHFVAHRKNDVLVVVLDGEPGGAPEQDSLPVALRQGAEVPALGRCAEEPPARPQDFPSSGGRHARRQKLIPPSMSRVWK